MVTLFFSEVEIMLMVAKYLALYLIKKNCNKRSLIIGLLSGCFVCRNKFLQEIFLLIEVYIPERVHWNQKNRNVEGRSGLSQSQHFGISTVRFYHWSFYWMNFKELVYLVFIYQFHFIYSLSTCTLDSTSSCPTINRTFIQQFISHVSKFCGLPNIFSWDVGVNS